MPGQRGKLTQHLDTSLTSRVACVCATGWPTLMRAWQKSGFENGCKAPDVATFLRCKRLGRALSTRVVGRAMEPLQSRVFSNASLLEGVRGVRLQDCKAEGEDEEDMQRELKDPGFVRFSRERKDHQIITFNQFVSLSVFSPVSTQSRSWRNTALPRRPCPRKALER